MIEVFGVTPSCRISCTPITAPNTHNTINRIRVAGAKVEGCCLSPAGACGIAVEAGVARDRSLITANPGQDGGSSFRYRMARRNLPMVLSCRPAPSSSCIAVGFAYHSGWECGCSSMAEQKLPKLTTRVRFPSPAPNNSRSSTKPEPTLAFLPHFGTLRGTETCQGMLACPREFSSADPTNTGSRSARPGDRGMSLLSAPSGTWPLPDQFSPGSRRPIEIIFLRRLLTPDH